MIKNQELKDLATSFDSETARLNETIKKKDEYIHGVNQQLS